MKLYAIILYTLFEIARSFYSPLIGQSQPSAGSNKVIFNGDNIELGIGNENPNFCYSWTASELPEEIVNGKHSLQVLVSPTTTKKYTLTILDNDFNIVHSSSCIVTVLPDNSCECPNNMLNYNTIEDTLHLHTFYPGTSHGGILLSGPEIHWKSCLNVQNQKWRVLVIDLTCKGKLYVPYWPSYPNSMITPNTANPVDGGNVNNDATINNGQNKWDYVISDMENYNISGTNQISLWHSYNATLAHEKYHWVEDWMKTCVQSNWSIAINNLINLNVDASIANSQDIANLILKPQVSPIYDTFVINTDKKWDTDISPFDKPGYGGGGFAAGASKLTELINAVRVYAKNKGWW